jgi:hypothetical protein
VRRIVLKEHDIADGANIGLISETTRYALDHGDDVILDGILNAARYGSMLDVLQHDHRGQSSFYYFDVSFAETLRPHATRPSSQGIRHRGDARLVPGARLAHLHRRTAGTQNVIIR